MIRFGYIIIILMILCFSLCACAPVEEVTIIRGSLIVPSKQSRPLPPRFEALQPDIQEDDLTDEDEQPERLYSDKLRSEFYGKENKALIAAIEEWLGTRYQMGGCSKSGIDCSCFVKAVYQKVYGFDLERSSQEIFEQNLTQVDMDELKTGDLLFFKSESGRIFHVGIYLSKNKFAHVSRLRGVKVSDLDYFKDTLFSAKRLKKNLANMD